MTPNLFKKFKKHAIEQLKEFKTKRVDIVKMMLDKKTTYGFLIVDDNSEQLDNHCEQCATEVLPFIFNSKTLGSYATLIVGSTKYYRLIENKLPIKIEILFSLKNKEDDASISK